MKGRNLSKHLSVTNLCIVDSEDGMGSAAGFMNMGCCCDSVYTREEIRTRLLMHGGSLRIHGEHKKKC